MAQEHSIRQTIDDSLQRALRGYFDDALDLVNDEAAGLSPHDRVDLLRAQSRVHTLRGYVQRADACLQRAMELAGAAELSGTARLYLDMHKCFVETVCCGHSGLNYSVVQTAVLALQQYTSLQDYTRDDIDMLSHVCRIDIVNRLLYGSKGLNAADDVLQRLSPLLEQAIALRRWVDVYTLSVPYCSTLSPTRAIEWLRHVLGQNDVPDLVRANLTMELVDRLAGSAEDSTIDAYLDVATRAYEECGHRYGQRSVQQRRLDYTTRERPNVLLQDQINILVSYLDEDYPFGVLYAAKCSLHLASNLSDSRIYITLQHVFHSICHTAGLRHQRLQLELQLLGTLNLGTAHQARVLELGRALWTESQASHYWSIAYNAGRILSLAHQQTGQIADAEHYAHAVLEISSRHDLGLDGDAVYQLAVVRSSRSASPDKPRSIICQEVIDMLSDSGSDSPELACQKLHLKAQLAGELFRITSDQQQQQLWETQMHTCIDEAKLRAQHLAAETKLDAIGNCDDICVSHFLWLGRSLVHHEHENKAIALCDALIQSYEAINNTFRVAMKHMLRASCRFQIYQKTKLVDHITAADRDYGKAGDLLEQIHMTQHALNARHCQTRDHYILYFGLAGFNSSTVHALLSRCEMLVDELRKEHSVLSPLEALHAKQQLAQSAQARDIYAWAIHVTMTEKHNHELWLWSQKRKARSVSDLLALGILLPKAIKQSLKSDEVTGALLHDLANISNTLKCAPTNEKIYLRQQLDDIELKLAENPDYADFLHIRDGVVSGVAQLSVLAAQDQVLNDSRSVIFVDWIINSDRIYALITDCGTPEASQLCDCGISETEVRLWQQQHFATDEARRTCLQQDTFWAQDRPLRQLDRLISPLADCSRPDDILILSVTGALAGVPIHVLGLPDGEDTQALIERNPVVFTPSFSALQSCVRKSISRDQSSKPFFSYAFDNAAELERIKTQMQSCASAMQGVAQHATKPSFVNGISHAPLIHFHGHCHNNATHILGQALEFNSSTQEGPGTSPDTMTANPLEESSLALTEFVSNAEAGSLLASDGASAPNMFTVEDAFHVALTAAPLITMVACQSASQVISEGDEPLGLISGLLCAGSSSVIAASWKIPSGTGRVFSSKLYKEMSKNQDAGKLVDVAVALQRAVLAVRDHVDEYGDSKESTYHWGAFCLHGSWFYKVPNH